MVTLVMLLTSRYALNADSSGKRNVTRGSVVIHNGGAACYDTCHDRNLSHHYYYCYCYYHHHVTIVPGPAISFLIRLSFVDGGEGGAVSAPVFWDMNGLTLRGGELARVCFVAGELG